MVPERTLVLTTRKIPLKYICRACVSVQMCTILKTRDFVFTYLNCLSCLHFFMVYLKSDKVSILFYISSKGVPDDSSKISCWMFFRKDSEISSWVQLLSNFDAQKSNFVLSCMELCSNYFHKHAFKYFRHHETIFNHI